jgi:iron complex outermembrane receptor protein
MSKRLFLVLVIIGLGSFGYAKESVVRVASDPIRIMGIVTDINGDPLQGVRIFLEHTTFGTISELSGRFDFTVDMQPNSVLVFSLTGYQTNRLVYDEVLRSATALRIVLTEIQVTGDDVFVTASRISRLTGSVPVSFRSIDARDIQSRNNSRLDETLRFVPGLSLAENQVSIRGSTGFSYGTGSRVLLLVDGSPLMGPDTNDIRFTAIPMSQVQRVEIIKGPGSALYGSGALGGVINLITQPIRNQTQTHIRTFIGAYEPTTNVLWKRNWEPGGDWRPYGGVEVGHSQQVHEAWGLRVNGLYLGDAGYTENARGYALQGYVKATWTPDPDTELDLQTVFRHYRNQVFLYWNGKNDALRYGRIAFGSIEANGKSYTTGQQLTFLPSFRRVLNDRMYYQIRGRAYALRSQPLFSDGTPQPKEKVIKGLRYGGEGQLTWLPEQGSASSLIAGLSADAIAADAEIFIGVDNQPLRSQPEYAAFTQFEFKPVGSLLISAGLRYDAYQIDTQDLATKMSPKLSASYALTRTLSIRSAFGQGFRVPAISERFVSSTDYLPLEPNLNLRPEESTGIEAGIRYQRTSRSGTRFEFDVVAFQNEYKNLIEPRFRPSIIGFQFINVSQARVQGVETTIDTRLRDDQLRISLGHTYLDHEDTNTGAPLSYRSDHQFVLSSFAKVWRILSAGVDFQYLSKPKKVDTDFSLFVRDASTFEPKQLLDFRIQSDLSTMLFHANSKRTATVSVIVRNALNHFYVERAAFLGRPRTYELSIQLAL